jgi:superfamily II DNA/RNA helicase
LVIGTAGRINDLITRRFLAVDWMKRVILDEADEIFWRGFEENVKDIFSNLPCDVTICCFAEREM